MTDAEAEAPIVWPPPAKWPLIGKDPEAGKDRRQKEKGTTEDEMVRQHHRLNEHKSEQTLKDSGGQSSLECCSPWGSHRVKHNLVTKQVIRNCLSQVKPIKFEPWL